MSLYNTDGSVRLTVVDGSTLTGLQALDGSYNVVINNGTTLTGRMHPCGAYNAVVVTSTTEVNNLNGSINIISDGAGGYTLVSSKQGAQPTQVTYDTSTNTLVTAMSVAPSTARKNAMNSFIVGLKQAGLWDTISTLHILAAHDEQAGRLNWVNPGQITLTNSSAVFEVDRGFTGNGTSSYLDYGVGLASLPLITINNHTMLFRSRTDNNSNGRDMGTIAGVNSYVSGRNSTALNTRAHAETVETFTVANSIGLYGFARGASGTYNMLRNGVFVSPKTIASSTFGTGNVSLLRSGGFYSVRQCASAINATAWTEAQFLSYYNLEQAYLLSVGAV